jgi:hypothetical protein
MSEGSMLWRGLHFPGHEYARLRREASEWLLEGVAALTYESCPCRLDYAIRCGEDWLTRTVRVSGWVGEARVDVNIEVDPSRRWMLNGQEHALVEGCTDIDLNFSPSTNLLPIRRLRLEVGSKQPVRAAWLRFPSLDLEPLEQEYARLDEDTYRYTSGGGKFVAELKVRADGFVTSYPEIWMAE